MYCTLQGKFYQNLIKMICVLKYKIKFECTYDFWFFSGWEVAGFTSILSPLALAKTVLIAPRITLL